MSRRFGFGILVIGITFLAGCADDDGGLTEQERFVYETEKIDQYITDNNLDVNVDFTSGIRYQVTSEGVGLSPYIVDSVTLSYTAKVLETEETVITVSNQKVAWRDLVLGIRIAIRQIQEGGSFIFFLPSPYAYGATGSSTVPVNATLIYEMSLTEIHAQQLRADILKIDQYLDANNLPAQIHPSGLRYNIEALGSGTQPNLFSVVTVTYDGYLLNNGTKFDSGFGSTFNLNNLIAGWQIGIPLIKQGGKIKLYVPSTFGYGPTGSEPSIPGNAQLIFDVELIAVQ